MILRLLEILTEYLSIILCMHKAAKKKITIDRYVLIYSIVNIVSIFLAQQYKNECNWLRLIVYANFLVYCKKQLVSKWSECIKVFGIMFITIPSLQLVIYFGTKFMFKDYTARYEYGIVVNCLICFIILIWHERYIFYFAKRIVKSNGLVLASISILFFTYLLYRYNQFQVLLPQLVIQSVVSIIGIGIILLLWINSESEKKRKAKELQLYKIYNKTFEEAVTAIRLRQHEFDNHITAIKCLQLTIDNQSELIKAQNEYCDKVLQENSFNRLLKLNTEPIITGFLYSKFMNAKEQGIKIEYDVHSIEIAKHIEVSELIEIIGILFDNAVEALLDQKDTSKILIVKIHQEDNTKISVEIANKSRKYLNKEIEKFCECGYSTKGKNRGIGLKRVKEIVEKYKADFYIENIMYNMETYLSFRIIL